MLFLVFLYSASFAYAQDYALASGKFYDLKEGEEKIKFEQFNGAYNICENEEKTIPILITNKANTDNKYSLEVIGASWGRLNANEFSLPKKQSGVVFLNLNPLQGTNGMYDVKVSGVSSTGKIKRALNLEINVEKCYSVKLELEAAKDKICGGTEKQYKGNIVNDGKSKIEAEVSLQAPNWISIDKNSFSIDANANKAFVLNVDVPSDAGGIFNVVAKAAIKNLSSIKSEKNFEIEVVPRYDCYKAEVVADEKIKNYFSEVYAQIKIRNAGMNQATYGVSLEGPNWLSLEPENLTIDPGQPGNINLNINPNANISEGTYTAKINIKFDDIAYSRSIDIVLKKNKFSKLKSFFVFYQAYIYPVLFIVILLLIFRLKITNSIKTKYKNYRLRKARLKALEKARKARQEKRKNKMGT